MLYSADDSTPAASAAPAGELRVGTLKVNKVLFLGNSITLHGPAENIGWSGNWGMAASAEAKDYVHLVTDRLANAAGGKPQIMVKNIADFERQYDTYDLKAGLKAELQFEPNLVVLAIGENVPGLTTDEARTKYAAAYARLLAELKAHGKPAIFVRTSFWADEAKDAVMSKAAQDAGATVVDIGTLGKDETLYARSERKIEHAGVAGHPGDKGMQAIAAAISAAIEKQAGLTKAASSGRQRPL